MEILKTGTNSSYAVDWQVPQHYLGSATLMLMTGRSLDFKISLFFNVYSNHLQKTQQKCMAFLKNGNNSSYAIDWQVTYHYLGSAPLMLMTGRSLDFEIALFLNINSCHLQKTQQKYTAFLKNETNSSYVVPRGMRWRCLGS